MVFEKACIAGICLAVLGLAAGSAQAASQPAPTLRVISSMATRPFLTELFAQFEKDTGIRIELESVGGVTAAKRVESGEDFDVVILAASAIDKLTTAGKIKDGSKVDLVRSGVAMAVRKGARTFDVSSEEALKQAVLQARTIGYSTGPSGVHLSGLFQKWGIAEEIKDRTVQPAPGVPVGSLVAKGEVELGFQQLSELLHVQGIEILGPLPVDIQIMTVFSSGVAAGTKQGKAAQDLLTFLSSPQAAEAKRKNGMDPA